MKKYESNVEQPELLVVKEEEKHVSAKRVDIVSLKMVKERSFLYQNRAIRSPEDGYNLFKQFLGELDREYFVVNHRVTVRATKLRLQHIAGGIPVEQGLAIHS